MYNEDGIYVGGRYTVVYEGYLFYGDNEGLNSHDYDDWDDVQSLINAYGNEEDLDLYVKDNEYEISWYKGEWS